MYDIYGNDLHTGSFRYSVYCTPVWIDFTDYTDCIDEQNISVNVLKKISNTFGGLQYVGGICVNNKIYCTPNTSTSILVYDITNNSFSYIDTGLPSIHFKFTGQFVYRNRIYMMHRGLNFLLEIDPTRDTVRIIGLPLNYRATPLGDYQDSYHYCGVLSDQGYLYQPPAYQNNDVIKIDMRSFSVQKFKVPSDAFTGAVRIPNQNKALFIGTMWCLWDCDTDTYVTLPDMPSGCYDMVYDSRKDILVGTTTGGKFIALDLDDYSLVESSVVSGLTTGYGISLGLDGKYWHLEGNKAYWASYSNDTFTTGSITSPDTFSGSTPYTAGQAIDTDGNIYGIAGSGCMSKLSFNNVEDKLPEYMCESQYYGKY